MIKNLCDTTFMIPVRIDSIKRLENVWTVTDFILQYFSCRVIVLEVATSPVSLLQKLLNEKIDFIHVHDPDPVFYKTKYVNEMARLVTSPYLAVWDADILASSTQIEGAVSRLRMSESDVAYPFDGCCYDTSDILQECFNLYRTFDVLMENVGKMDLMYGSDVVGGALFVRTDKFLTAGGDNECFYGWGPEDHERHERFLKLGYRISREPGPLFHLTHPRGINSNYRDMRYRIKSNSILQQTRVSSERELEKNRIKL